MEARQLTDTFHNPILAAARQKVEGMLPQARIQRYRHLITIGRGKAKRNKNAKTTNHRDLRKLLKESPQALKAHNEYVLTYNQLQPSEKVRLRVVTEEEISPKDDGNHRDEYTTSSHSPTPSINREVILESEYEQISRPVNEAQDAETSGVENQQSRYDFPLNLFSQEPAATNQRFFNYGSGHGRLPDLGRYAVKDTVGSDISGKRRGNPGSDGGHAQLDDTLSALYHKIPQPSQADYNTDSTRMQPGSHSSGGRSSSLVPTTLPHQPTASGYTSHRMLAPAPTINVQILDSQEYMYFPKGTTMEVPVQNPERFPRHLIRGLAPTIVITDLKIFLEDFIPIKITGKLQNSLYHAFWVDIKADERLFGLFGMNIVRPGVLSPERLLESGFHLELRPVLGLPDERWSNLILVR
ncbi:hypothetical protein BS50DRAFT_629408 [Corynespora cassiicola Philippines]|uniref:Uncharacterized protein n=1 Tax=Corynespora cassiicola Philippines TaxID=1448308 RepID=A0A2T2P6R4_CORCC|nr:hypothetical protein BS50DRAFT_629408 [Corynespora cassiicola Philippines]